MHEDMDAATMIRRAQDRGAVLETYDPNQLVGEIQDLLRERGLHPDIPPDTGRAGMATSAAGMLLRAFGILPAATPRLTDSTHPIPTLADRRASRECPTAPLRSIAQVLAETGPILLDLDRPVRGLDTRGVQKLASVSAVEPGWRPFELCADLVERRG